MFTILLPFLFTIQYYLITYLYYGKNSIREMYVNNYETKRINKLMTHMYVSITKICMHE